jgi:hypothetical protein
MKTTQNNRALVEKSESCSKRLYISFQNDEASSMPATISNELKKSL